MYRKYNYNLSYLGQTNILVQREINSKPVDQDLSNSVDENKNDDGIQAVYDSDGDFVGSSSDEYTPSNDESSDSNSNMNNDVVENNRNETHESLSQSSVKPKDSFLQRGKEKTRQNGQDPWEKHKE